jgi:hypothetical protein
MQAQATGNQPTRAPPTLLLPPSTSLPARFLVLHTQLQNWVEAFFGMDGRVAYDVEVAPVYSILSRVNSTFFVSFTYM